MKKPLLLNQITTPPMKYRDTRNMFKTLNTDYLKLD